MPSRQSGLVALAVAVSATSLLRGQQQRPAPPSFASGVELIRVDFVVSDRTGAPVNGLTINDFVVKEDGKERPIVAFESFGGDHRAGRTPFAGSVAGPFESAATVLIVDDAQLTPQQAARLRPALRTLLTRVSGRSTDVLLLAPESKVAIGAVLPDGADAITSAIGRIAGQRLDDASTLPVTDVEALAIARGDLDALRRVSARFMAINPELSAEQADMFARERANMLGHDARARRNAMYDQTLRGLDWLSTRHGRHSLVIVSSGFANDPDDGRYQQVAARSLQVNAPIHFVDARGLAGAGVFQDAQYSAGLGRNADEGPFAWWQAAEGSANLAADTGGVVVSNTNDLERGLGRILDAMATYYVVAYEPRSQKAGFHRIKIEVRRKHLQVVARRGYFAGVAMAKAEAEPEQPAAPRVPDVSIATGAAATPEPVPALVPLPALLQSASAYAQAFQRELTGVVMEETYSQEFSTSSASRIGQYTLVGRRDLKSDLLLIRPGNGARDVEFRDVFEVDGRPVRDRQERLTRLFLDPSKTAADQIRAIIADSARYNIGSIERTLNTPTLALMFLVPPLKATFTFANDHRRALAAAAVAGDHALERTIVMAFEERPHDTLIHAAGGKDLPARGRFWIDAETGRVWMTELVAEDRLVRAVVDVTYRFDPAVSLLVPSEMRERYEGLRNGALVEGRATYDKFRRFQVKVSTDIRPH